MTSTGVDDERAKRWLNAQMFLLAESPDFERSKNLFIRELDELGPQLSAATYGSLLDEVRRLDASRFATPSYRQAVDFLSSKIRGAPEGIAAQILGSEVPALYADAKLVLYRSGSALSLYGYLHLVECSRRLCDLALGDMLDRCVVRGGLPELEKRLIVCTEIVNLFDDCR